MHFTYSRFIHELCPGVGSYRAWARDVVDVGAGMCVRRSVDFSRNSVEVRPETLSENEVLYVFYIAGIELFCN